MAEPARPTGAAASRAELDRLFAALEAGGTSADPSLRDLLVHCSDRLAEIDARPPEPVRTLHHFACSGGTLIAKALASQPNTVLLSEIDPLSRQHLRKPKQPFFPTDLIAGLRYCPRIAGDDAALAVFHGALRALRAELTRQGYHLVLRDHAHSQFCTDRDPSARPSLHALVGRVAPVLGAVTLRHPLESFLSLRGNGWVHFAPDTLQEYCLRYGAFLDAHAALPRVKYEDFVANPGIVTADLCRHLALPFDAHFETLMPLALLTGDSGRSSATIGPRPRKPVPDALRREAAQSPAYAALCERLGYAPDPGTDG